MRTAQIISVNQNKIIYKRSKKRYSLLMSLCLFCIVSFITFFSLGGTNVQQVGSFISYLFDPVNSLYSDNSSIVFTSINMISKDKLNFVVPIITSNVEIDTLGNIVFQVDNAIMVKSPEAGVVEEVGQTIDGVKYIKIVHSINVTSIIENLDIIGVQSGEIIKSGQDIATAKVGSKVTLKLFEDEIQVVGLKISQSKILWQN